MSRRRERRHGLPCERMGTASVMRAVPRPLLLVEENAELRRVQAELLDYEGYPVALAANAREALQFIERRTPGLVVVSLELPLPGGRMFLQQLQEAGLLAHVPVLLTSREALEDQEASDLGARAMLRKPLQLEHFLAAVRRWYAPSHPDGVNP